MELKFAPTTRPEKINPTVQRRQKLVRRIDEQIAFVRQMVGGQNPRAAWAWMDEAGHYLLPIKYGRHNIELKKGMFSVECANLDEVEHALCTIRAMTLAGEFDAELEKTTSAIRSRFENAKQASK